MRKWHIGLWVLQWYLGLFLGFASGFPKLFVPHDQIPLPIPISSPFLYFIGLCEVAGAIALIVPGLVRRYTWLTPLAAACFTALTVCATVYQLMAGAPGNALFAVVTGALCALVAYGRWRLVPLSGRGPAD